MSFCVLMTFPHALGVPGGGTEDCIQTALHLHAAGAEVVLVSVVSHTISRFPRPETSGDMLGRQRIADLRAGGVEVVTVRQNRLHYLLDGLSVRRAVRRILSQRRVDAVLGWHHEVAFLPRLLRSHKAIFGMIASNGRYEQWHNAARGVRAAAQHFFVVRQLQSAEIVFARSVFMSGLITELFALNARHIHVAHCGIDPAFAELRRVSSSELTRFLFTGWFIPEKGIFDTLKALGKLAAAGERNWTLKIAGWGDEESVRRLAAEQGISDQIAFVGTLGRAGLCRELTWAQLAILPSYAESFGLAVAESQLAGLPVVAYDVGGVPEIVENKRTGWLVPAGDLDALAAAIQAAIKGPEAAFRMGVAGRERVRERFNWAKTGETMLEVLKRTAAAETLKAATHEPKLERV